MTHGPYVDTFITLWNEFYHLSIEISDLFLQQLFHYAAVVIKHTTFWDITTCSPLKVNQHFRGTYRLHLQGRRISRARNQHESRWQAELKMEAICSSETSADFQHTTRCYIPEDSFTGGSTSSRLKSA
jgi:hypothetical protein